MSRLQQMEECFLHKTGRGKEEKLYTPFIQNYAEYCSDLKYTNLL